jgi:hypothetical protein
MPGDRPSCRESDREPGVGESGSDSESTLDLLEEFTISIPALGCGLTIPAQGPLSSVSLVNWPEAVSSLSGITYTSTGICGSSGTNGTLSGTNEYLLNGGVGTIIWDP